MKAIASQLALALVCLSVSGATQAAEPPGAKTPTTDQERLDYSRAEPSHGWSAQVDRDEQQQPVAEGPAEFVLRVYAGGRGIVEDRDGRALALDVQTEIETCADGSTRVNGVRIGSWRYAMEGSCPTERGSRIRVSRPAREVMAADAALRLRCRRSSLSCQPDGD